MRVLWLSPANTLFNEKGDRAYNGKGWVASLQSAVRTYAPDIELGAAFLSEDCAPAVVQDGVTYFRIKKKNPKGFSKLLHNWTGGKEEDYSAEVLKIASEFRPDIIQVFGCETKLAPAALSVRNIPVTVHIQGILSECIRHFFPPGTAASDMVTAGTFFNEIILRNGYIHLYEDYRRRSASEMECLRRMKYAMGRTAWDRAAVNKYSEAEYFHVDEVLRPIFYRHAASHPLCRSAHAGSFTPGSPVHQGKRIRIASTLSPVPYKGLDLVLKTASALEGKGFDVRWNVAGIGPGSDMEKIFEKKTGVTAEECGVRLLGVMDEESLVKLLLESDIYVHPSYIENSPNSVCEAQILGMPVIAADTGGIPSIVEDRRTGIIVPPGDAEATAEAIAALAEDRTKAAETAEAAASAAASRHDREKIVSSLLSVYQLILQESRSAVL